MKTGRYRWNIKWVMILVAILACLFGVFGVAEGIGVGIALLILLGPLALAQPGRRLGVLSWLSAMVPTILASSFLTTWLTGWAILGRRPRVTLDDPKFISVWVDIPYATTFVFLLLWLPSALACLGLATLRGFGQLDRESPPMARIAKALLHPVLWYAGYLFLGRLDYLGEWFLD